MLAGFIASEPVLARPVLFLREKMLDSEKYDRARREYLSQEPLQLRKPGAKYPKREGLYGR